MILPAEVRRMRFYSDESGSSLVEAALSITLLLTFIFGVIDCGRALYAYHFASYAAREGTRYAMVRGSSWGSTTCANTTSLECNASAANVQSYIQSIAPLGIDSATPTPLSVATSWPGTAPTGIADTCPTTTGYNSPGCVVSVKVSYSFNYVLPFLPKTTLLFTSTSKVAISQ